MVLRLQIKGTETGAAVHSVTAKGQGVGSSFAKIHSMRSTTEWHVRKFLRMWQ